MLRYCRNVRLTWVKFNSKDTKESEQVFDVLSTKSNERTQVVSDEKQFNQSMSLRDVAMNNFEWDQAKEESGDLGLLAATKVLITVR